MDLDSVINALEPYLPKQGNNKSILNFILYMTMMFAFALFISACVVSSAANAGFNIVLTSLLNILVTGGALYILRNSKSPIAIGFLIGSMVMMAIINLETAVYWGQISHCKRNRANSHPIDQYSCDDPAGYGAVSAFASLLLICEALFSYWLINTRGEIIDETGAYDVAEKGNLYGAEQVAQSDYV